MQSDFAPHKNMVVCMRFPCVNACTAFQRAAWDQRSPLVCDFFCLHDRAGRGALDSCYFLRRIYEYCTRYGVLIFMNAVLIASCKQLLWSAERLTEWDGVGSWKYFRQVSWVLEVDIEKRRLDFVFNRFCCVNFCKLSRRTSHHGLQTFSTRSAFLDGTSSSTLKKD